MTARAPNVPTNTSVLLCCNASSIARKNVLSPISENKMRRKPETKPSVKGLSPTTPGMVRAAPNCELMSATAAEAAGQASKEAARVVPMSPAEARGRVAPLLLAPPPCATPLLTTAAAGLDARNTASSRDDDEPARTNRTPALERSAAPLFPPSRATGEGGPPATRCHPATVFATTAITSRGRHNSPKRTDTVPAARQCRGIDYGTDFETRNGARDLEAIAE
mmetsp:Transcript_15310/g.42818  ORF Transcript_15310/g.42818 Transcript_15310/m.42818 type:complete len:222 (+) Transcript_15310:725-1390(+)